MSKYQYYYSAIMQCFEDALNVQEQDSKQRKLRMAVKYARRYFGKS